MDFMDENLKKGEQMKKGLLTTLLILVFAIGAFAADGPVDKGSMMLGGTLYFMNQGGDYYKAMSTTGDDATTTIGIMPEFGYFIAPSIMIGASFEMLSETTGDDKTNGLAFGPMVGYFFNMDDARAEAKGGLYPYIKGFFNMGTMKMEGPWMGDETYKTSITQFGGMAGINYMLTNTVALDFGFKFSSDSFKAKEPIESDEAVTGTTMWFGAGISTFIY